MVYFSEWKTLWKATTITLSNILEKYLDFNKDCGGCSGDLGATITMSNSSYGEGVDVGVSNSSVSGGNSYYNMRSDK